MISVERGTNHSTDTTTYTGNKPMTTKNTPKQFDYDISLNALEIAESTGQVIPRNLYIQLTTSVATSKLDTAKKETLLVKLNSVYSNQLNAAEDDS